MKTPRSNYAARLAEFPAVALTDVDAAKRNGKWRSHFRERIGPSFTGRLVFEIGCGDADFLIRVASKFPTTAFVGLDWKYKAIYDAARGVEETGLQNVSLIRGRAQDLERFFGAGELSEIWLFHPDPCDRDVELGHRLVRESFLQGVFRTLDAESSSSFVLKTDHAGYYQWTLALLGVPQPDWTRQRVRSGELMPVEKLPTPSAVLASLFNIITTSADYWNDPSAQVRSAGRLFSGETTGFERRFLKKRLPIYFLELQRNR